jgi:hypothetical protein
MRGNDYEDPTCNKHYIMEATKQNGASKPRNLSEMLLNTLFLLWPSLEVITKHFIKEFAMTFLSLFFYILSNIHSRMKNPTN